MRILDIDLDFFLDRIHLWPNDTETRLPEGGDGGFTAWDKIKVIDFLYYNCGLKENKIPGKVVEKHHEALLLWEDLIKKGLLDSPFEVVHIDAHADLGMGDSSYKYLMENLMHLPLNQRQSYDKQKLNEGNYLLFAAALGMLSKLVYVRHPEWKNDFHPMHMENFSLTSENIVMKATKRLNACNLTKENIDVVNMDAPIPFIRTGYKEYNDKGDFNFMVLSISPQYTPKSSDDLIPVIERYIDKI